ncbi:hypothetical protein Btru_076593 [Bulinus truncatus]|nr:hypothetical protein Btru_076593 [Bulinus truncatus]
MKISPSDQSSFQLLQWKSISCQDTRPAGVKSNGRREKIQPLVPCGRFHHASCSHRQFVYILGGKDRCSPLKDFWRLDIVNLKWDLIDDRKPSIPHLEGHTMLSYQDELLIFGGTFHDISEGTPLWIFNTDLLSVRKWCMPTSHQPSGRREHSAVIYKNCMYIYGGYLDNSGSSDEFWLFNIADEIWQQIPHIQPGKRHGHVAIVALNKMWLHGGMKDLVPFADLWVYNFNLCSWTKVKGRGASPTLANHSGHFFDKWLVLLGGTCSGEPMHDIWIFNIDTQTWKQISPQVGELCPSLSLHTSVLLNITAIKNFFAEEEKSLPHLTANSSQTPSESIQHHAASLKSMTVEHRPNVTDNMFDRSDDSFQLSYLHCDRKSEKVISLEAETSFSHDVFSPVSSYRRPQRILNTSVMNKVKQMDTKPAVGDNLPLLQRIHPHSFSSEEDLGVNNPSVTISDEQDSVSTKFTISGAKLTKPDRNIQQDNDQRKTEKYQARTSLAKKIHKQKTGKSYPAQENQAEKLAEKFENPFYSALFDEGNKKMILQNGTVAENTSGILKPYDNVRLESHVKEDMLIEDLECLDIDQLFKATSQYHSASSRIKYSSLKDISNYNLYISDFVHQSFTPSKLSRQSSQSFDNFFSKSCEPFLFNPTSPKKQLSYSYKDEVNNLYKMQHSVGIQTSDSLWLLNKPKSADSALTSDLLNDEKSAFAITSSQVAKSKKDTLGIIEMIKKTKHIEQENFLLKDN